MRTALLVLLALVAACSSDEKPAPRPTPDPYLHTAPPPGPVPEGLEPATWSDHLRQDLVPFWSMEAAKGTPEGNFPTTRNMKGEPVGSGARKPRMLGRQTFAYAVQYLMTGDDQALSLARAGARWILEHARDGDRGAFADLDASGEPLGSGDRFAQDLAYTIMGPAAVYFVTRDAALESAVLQARDLLFDPGTYWDAENERIRDGLDATFTREAFMSSAGSWELVAQLDPVTAFLLLVQPVLSSEVRREQVLGDLRTLSTTMVDHFHKDGFFWGTTGGKGQFGSRHTDFGHMLKAYWAVLQVDKRLSDRPFHDFVSRSAPPVLAMAFDAENGRWASRPTSATAVAYGSDWWQYAEADQLTATLALHDPAHIPVLERTAAEWRARYVDRSREAREVVSSIRRDGSGWGWPDADTAKCNEWKNGFHSHEHALVMFLFAHWLEDTPAPLYFAFPADRAAELAAASRPYTFDGDVAGHEDLGPLPGADGLHKVRVTFEKLR